MPYAFLPDRGVIRVSGPETNGFLNGLLTADTRRVAPGDVRYGALLTPQGKIIVDFLIVGAPEEEGGGVLIDAPAALTSDLTRRLTLYRLRAKVTIEDLSTVAGVAARWDEPPSPDPDAIVYPDPREARLGVRLIGDRAALEGAAGDADAYDRARIALAIPKGGLDFVYGDAFPHEADLDQLGGVDFDKGCYVGQEVVSRTQHRGGARTRVLPVRFDGPAPEPGAEVTAGGRAIGRMGSGSGAIGRGLATLRLDRASEAIAAGEPIAAGGVQLRPFKPDWARFDFPVGHNAGDAA